MAEGVKYPTDRHITEVAGEVAKVAADALETVDPAVAGDVKEAEAVGDELEKVDPSFTEKVEGELHHLEDEILHRET